MGTGSCNEWTAERTLVGATTLAIGIECIDEHLAETQGLVSK